MAITYSGSVKLSVAGILTDTSVDLQTNSSSLNYAQSYTLTNGTGSNQANMLWSDQRTIAASTSENLDLAGGLTSVFGTTLTFTKIKGIIIYAHDTNTNNVLIGGDAASVSTWVGNANDVIVVRPGATFALVTPDSTAYAITGTTADILKVANSSSGSSVVYDVILIGCV